MSEIEIRETVTELLKPLSAKTPTGEDIAKSEDPVANAAYAGLEADLSKLTDIDYQACAQKAADILRTYSKHLRVAAWLTLCWYRISGLEGFKNGLFLIAELLKQYGENLFPEKPAQRSKAIQYLNIDKRFHLIEKEEINDGNARVVLEIQQLLNQISAECKKQFSESLPNLTAITAIINEKAKLASTTVKETNSDEKESTSASPETKPVPESGKAQAAENGKTPAAEEAVAEAKAGSPSDEAETPPINQTEPPAQKPEIEIPAEVADLLQNISSGSPGGGDAENSEDQDTWVIYMNLESEMAKYGNNDYEQCAKWASQILQEKSKHLRVAVWLLVSWFRLAEINGTSILAGFRNGLLLLTELLKKYGDQLYPAEAAQKVHALQLLNTDTRLKLLGNKEANEKNAKEFVEIGAIFSEFEKECREKFPGNPPKLKAIAQIVNESAKAAQALMNQAAEREKRAKEKTDTRPPEQSAAESPAPGTQKAVERKTSNPPASAGASPSGQAIRLTGEKDAAIAIKNALLFFFEPESGNKDSRKVPADATIYGLSRVLRWGKLGLPPDKDKVTQIEGPNPQKQNFIRQLLGSKDYNALIAEIEINFLNREDFLFWLDAQRFVAQALEQKGGESAEAAGEIKIHLARLLNHFPALSKLLFKDKQTPFADAETLNWLEEEVKPVFGGGKGMEKILPPIMGEDYEPINRVYEEACNELPAKFEENLKTMQEAIAADTRQKGRFLRLLNLANYCYSAKRYSLAKALFNQLMSKIDEYNIIEWERALCVSVWQSVYKINQKLLNGEMNSQQKSVIEQQQAEMFDRIAKYDSVLALNLTNHEPNQGE